MNNNNNNTKPAATQIKVRTNVKAGKGKFV
jgi:hypothetical protein